MKEVGSLGDSHAEPLISVVTPFFNTGEYLAECIESVLAQTYSNFEYIVVDNHSTDGGGDIARRAAEKDDRIRVLSPPSFYSQAANFNFALAQISPDSAFTKVIMADDWLYPHCLEDMAQCGLSYPSAAMIGAYRIIEDAIDPEGLHVSQRLLSGRDAVRMWLIDGRFLFGTPSSVMYRSDVVRATPMFYPEGRIYQDTDAALRILRNEDFGFVHQVLTFSRWQEDSLTYRQRHYRSSELDRYTHLIEFGESYLPPHDYQYCLKLARRAVYAGFVKHWLRERFSERDESYWGFQNRGLAPVGERIRRRYFVEGALATIGQLLRHPSDALRFARGQPSPHRYFVARRLTGN
jgi:glycosyltransferase involved in cell wall biosynthesis